LTPRTSQSPEGAGLDASLPSLASGAEASRGVLSGLWLAGGGVATSVPRALPWAEEGRIFDALGSQGGTAGCRSRGGRIFDDREVLGFRFLG
jgi:hypothetical protein